MYVRTEMCHVHGKSSPYQHHTYEKHYIDCLKIKLGLDRSQGNSTYTTTTLSKEEIIDNHISVLSSLFFTWEMSIVIFSYCIGYQDYTNVQQTTLYRRSCQMSIQTTLYRRSCQVSIQTTLYRRSCQMSIPTTLYRRSCQVSIHTTLYRRSSQVSIQTTLYRRSCQVFYQALSKFFTFIFTTVKTGFQKYHDACFSISGVD